MFGCKVVLKKRELEVVASHFTQEERSALHRKLEAMDEANNASVAAAAEEPMQKSADIATAEEYEECTV